MSSLQNLPNPLQDEITGLVAASSIQAMEDLCSWRVTCKTMNRACKSLPVCRGLPLRRVLYHAFDGNDRYNLTFVQLHDTLVARLSSDEVGNPDAYYLAGFREVFMDNRIALRSSLHLLERVAAAGHQLAAYMLSLYLYRPNSGANNDDNTFRLIRKVEGEEEEAAAAGAGGGIEPTWWRSLECVCCRHQIKVDLARLLSVALPVCWDMEDGWPWPVRLAKPVDRGELQCAGRCSVPAGLTRGRHVPWLECWRWFCREEYKIRKECETVFGSAYW